MVSAIILLMAFVDIAINHLGTWEPPRDGTNSGMGLVPEPQPTTQAATENGAGSDVPIKTSQFHYLIPASKTDRRFCFLLASSAASRYPAPQIMGWNGTGLFDAAKTHLAKLRAIQVYLESLPREEDDDIVLVVDGYDVIMQLPPEIMLKRYFATMEAENKRTAERFSITLDQVKEQNLDTTLFFGPDKLCWPINRRAPRCWAIPPSTLPSKAFGPKTNNGDSFYMLPKWLNSGTLIGPANHMRDYIAATMKEIDHTYDPTYRLKDSDQYYLANVWGRQEYYRSKKLHGDEVPGGPGDRLLPRKFTNDQQVEFHVGIEYESAMFQTKGFYQPFNGWLYYNGTDTPTAMMTKDIFEEGDGFKPSPIEMPEEIQKSLSKIYDEIPEAHPGSTSNEWIRDVVLGTNYVTKKIWCLWHATGDKKVIEGQYTKFWFYPFARSLLKSAVKSLRASNKISNQPIGGRYWVHKTVYPDSDNLTDPLGGAWSDEEVGRRFIPWDEMCKHFDKDVLGGENAEPERIVLTSPGATNKPFGDSPAGGGGDSDD
ncbi:hypothetical protein B0J13DRAFT_680973 [Dactylonectria estremocensis]|uniref:Uncharacterized protein n=1 Tax=Dactylonectria estremocensis TaxID=1079267 RepID=A0A9P9DGC9_9HYPO|nr:hypothetical protein B0J13DRAFT_680973 [Dactylonectria estremocensis]